MRYTDCKDVVEIKDLKIAKDSLPKAYSGRMLYDKLQTWRAVNGLTVDEMCEKLGWVQQRFYALNKEKRTVFASTLAHIMTTLMIDPDFLFTAEEEDSYVIVLRKYPLKVLRWLASDEGKKIMLEQYGQYMFKEAQKELKKDASLVYKA